MARQQILEMEYDFHKGKGEEPSHSRKAKYQEDNPSTH